MQQVIKQYVFIKVPFCTEPGWEMDEYHSVALGVRTCSERACFIASLQHAGVPINTSFITIEELEILCLRNNIYVAFIDT